MGLLSGMTVLEIGGIGPGPFCAMLLADLGADVLRIEKPGKKDAGFEERPSASIVGRNKSVLTLDLKSPNAVEVIKIMVRRADAIIEGFRPGVMERLGLGPDNLMGENPALIYGRVTGWEQAGPWSQRAGHDINYISLAGALHAIGPSDGPPIPPLNLVGDYGGGAMYLACGLLAGLLEAQKSGQGQIIDAAMLDGALFQMSLFFSLSVMGRWLEERGSNHLDGGAPYYRTYETEDQKFVAVGALEQTFYEEFLEGLGISSVDLPNRMDPANWPEIAARFEAIIKTKPQSEWCRIFDQTNACVTPVLEINELAQHPHVISRAAVFENGGLTQPSPGPRFSRSKLATPVSPEEKGASTEEILKELGF